jgi:hypothetical protein
MTGSIPTPAAPVSQAPLAARALYWLHLCWLASLPPLAVLASWSLIDDVDSAWGWMLLPTLVYLGMLLQAYTLRLSLWSVLLIAAVPLQVGASAYFFGHAMAVFLVELCLIEIGAIGLGVGIGTLRVHRPSADAAELGGFAVVVVVCLLIMAGPVVAFYPSLRVGYEGASIWPVVLFVTAFATACLRHGRSLWQQAGQFRNSGRTASLDFDTGPGTRAVGPMASFEKAWLVFMGLYVAVPWGAARFVVD